MPASYVSFVAICLLLTITPGADTALILKSSLGGARRGFVMTTLGICAGLLFHATLSSLGLSAVLQKSAEVYSAIKLLGAGYLVYLGARSLYDAFSTDGAKAGESLLVSAEEECSGLPRTRAGFVEFRNGLLTNILNPKVAVFYMTFLPQFVNARRDVFLQSVVLATVHIAMSFVWLCLIGYFVTYFKAHLMKPSVKRKIETLTGLALIGFGVRLALSKN